MIIIPCENRKMETCLKKYRQKLDNIGQTREVRDRKVYEKPSEKKRRMLAKALYKRKNFN